MAKAKVVDMTTTSIAGAKFVGHKTIPVERWIDVPDNPVQRDTEGRARRARHLERLHPSHIKVAMCKTKDGTHVWKVDGHTRAYIWDNTIKANGAGPKSDRIPEKVYAEVFEVKDEAAAIQLFDEYDSASAVMRARDIVFGANREYDLHFDTPMLRSGSFKNALSQATRHLAFRVGKGTGGRHKRGEARGKRDYMDSRDMVKTWAPELLALDRISPNPKCFNSPIIAAALWSFALYPDDEHVHEFWDRFNRDAGTKHQGSFDYVEAARQYWGECRELGKSGSYHAPEIIGTMVHFAAKYRAKPKNMLTRKFRIQHGEWEEMRQKVCKKKGLQRLMGWID